MKMEEGENIIYLEKKKEKKKQTIVYNGDDIDNFLKINQFKVLINDDNKVLIHDSLEIPGHYHEYTFIESDEIIKKIKDNDCGGGLCTLFFNREKTGTFFNISVGKSVTVQYNQTLLMTIQREHFTLNEYIRVTNKPSAIYNVIKDNMLELMPDPGHIPYYYVISGCPVCLNMKHSKLTVDEFDSMEKIIISTCFSGIEKSLNHGCFKIK